MQYSPLCYFFNVRLIAGGRRPEPSPIDPDQQQGRRSDAATSFSLCRASL